MCFLPRFRRSQEWVNVPEILMNWFKRIGIVLLFGVSVLFGEEEAERRAQMPEAHFDVLDKYCLDCHDAATEEGQVNLEDLSFTLSDDIATAELWAKVLDSINSGEMPPEKKEPISEEEKEVFLRDLSEQMVLARSILSDSGGVVTLRRLNRREYANTVEELLGVRPDTSLLPDDRASAEYDTLGASLFFSSDQLEQYLATARNVLNLAAFQKKPAESKITRIEPEDIYQPKYAQMAVDRLDRATRYYQWRAAGGTDDVAKEHGFLDGWQAERQLNSFHQDYPPIQKWLTAPENKKGAALMITIKDGFTWMKAPRLRAWQPGRYILRARVGAYLDDPARFHYLEYTADEGQNRTRLGWRKVTAPVRKPEIIEFEINHPPGRDITYQFHKRLHMDRGDKNIEAELRKENKTGTPWGVWVDWYELEGPLPQEGNAKIDAVFAAGETGLEDEAAYARAVLQRFAEVAFRGEQPSDEFLDNLYGHYAAGREKGLERRKALIEPLAIVLASPSFLYLVEEADTESTGEQLRDVELASRLSYFLWSTAPDTELLSLAADGRLSDPGVLQAQTDRLLADPRSERFIDSFVYQWLEMYRLGMFAFAGRDYPTFDNAARDCAGEEVYQTFTSVLRERLPLRELIQSDQVVVNDVLADYYGIEGVKGHHWRRVPVPEGSPRGGLLGSAAVAAMGSDGQRSSPVERGAWVLRKLLNNPPPPAPPNVPQLSRFDGQVLSKRALEHAHQEDSQCAQCHKKIDPIGFGMENLDAAGMWRDTEVIRGRKRAVLATFPIDASGAFGPADDRREFDGFYQLKDHVADHVDDFALGLAEALIAYGMGRPYGFTDHDLAHAIVAGAKDGDYQIVDFIHGLVQSEVFRSR